jgi:hypothetical protein
MMSLTGAGLQVRYHGGSIELSVGGNIEAGKTEAGEIRVAQRLLDGRMSGHAPSKCHGSI